MTEEGRQDLVLPNGFKEVRLCGEMRRGGIYLELTPIAVELIEVTTGPHHLAKACPSSHLERGTLVVKRKTVVRWTRSVAQATEAGSQATTKDGKHAIALHPYGVSQTGAMAPQPGHRIVAVPAVAVQQSNLLYGVREILLRL